MKNKHEEAVADQPDFKTDIDMEQEIKALVGEWGLIMGEDQGGRVYGDYLVTVEPVQRKKDGRPSVQRFVYATQDVEELFIRPNQDERVKSYETEVLDDGEMYV